MITLEQLSKEQEKALEFIKDFIISPKRQMLLSGYSGTGKNHSFEDSNRLSGI